MIKAELFDVDGVLSGPFQAGLILLPQALASMFSVIVGGRLGMTEMVDRVENTRSNHISIEEETRTRSQADNL
jgi:hypothetical protein